MNENEWYRMTKNDCRRMSETGRERIARMSSCLVNWSGKSCKNFEPKNFGQKGKILRGAATPAQRDGGNVSSSTSSASVSRTGSASCWPTRGTGRCCAAGRSKTLAE
jgi:hypothetical protein